MVVTIEVPARRFEVQTEPVPLREALAASQDGIYTAVVEVSLRAWAHSVESSMTFDRCLARLLVAQGRPYNVRHRFVSATDDSVFVEASLDVGALAAEAFGEGMLR